MDLNSRINWTPGMEITAQTFIGLEQQLDLRQQIALRAALGNNQMGLLPGAVMNCNGIFAGSTFEIERLQCMAILPSGRIVNADERVAVPIPMLFGQRYYLTIGYGNEVTEFEKEGVSYVRPKYVYNIQTLEEVEAGDVMPLVRFEVKEGVFSIDKEFIPPCLMLSGDSRFKTYIERYIAAMETLARHKNMMEGDGKRLMYRYLFLLKAFNSQHLVKELADLTQEIVQAVDYFIVTPNENSQVEIPQPWKGDVQMWLDWVEHYLAGAASILDKVELEDNTIDFNALLAQAKKELYEQLHPELLEQLILQTKEELHQEMQQLTDNMTTYVRETLKKNLSDELTEDIDTRSTALSTRLSEDVDKAEQNLSKSLYDKLFSDVYLGVYNVLHEENEEHFIPNI